MKTIQHLLHRRDVAGNIFTFALTLALAFIALGANTAQAQTSGTCGDGVVWTLSESGDILTISYTGTGTGVMTDYSSPARPPWSANNTTMQTLVIDSGVASIGNSAFSGCTGFTGNLTIPNSVTTIGENAFSGCSGFTGNLTIPNSVTTIGDNAFFGCSGFMGNLILGNSVTTIGEGAFYATGFTGNLTIPNSVTTIGNNAFCWCRGFTGNLTIGNSVTTIGEKAFQSCPNFTGNLTIGNSVTTIGNNAFDGCIGLTGNLTIPNSVTTIGNYVFRTCRGLTGNLTIPNSVTTIGDYAFSDCHSFTGNLTIPNSVTTIRPYAFMDCSGFTGNLILGNSVTTIGNYAFANCSGFTGTLRIPNSVLHLLGGIDSGSNFRGCTGFTELILGDNLQEIPGYAFYQCSGLKKVTIGKSVMQIGDFAFYFDDSYPCNIDTIICRAVVPPIVGSTSSKASFYNVPATAAVFVPCKYFNTPIQRVPTWSTVAVFNSYSNSWNYYFSNLICREMTVLSNDTLLGVVNGNESDAYMGLAGTVYAAPKINAVFTGWSDGNTENPRHIELAEDDDDVLTAIFAPNKTDSLLQVITGLENDTLLLHSAIAGLQNDLMNCESDKDSLQALLDLCQNQTAIEGVPAGQFRVYPNPVSSGGVLNIEGEFLQFGDNIEIYDMQGNLIAINQASGKESVLPIGNLSTGTYLLRLAGKRGVKFEVK